MKVLGFSQAGVRQSAPFGSGIPGNRRGGASVSSGRGQLLLRGGSRKWVPLVGLMLLLLPHSGSAQNWSWTTQDVDRFGRYAKLALDEHGNVHVSYLNVQEGVKYGFRPSGSTQWFTMTIDGWNDYENLSTNLAIDQQGNPHICYTPGVMKYAYWDGEEWHRELIAPGSGLIAYDCSVVVAPDGTPHLTWYQLSYGDFANYFHLRYAILRDGAWQVRTVDFDLETGKWNSMVLDAEGNPHLSYSAFNTGLKYAYWNGKTWVVALVDGRTGSNTRYRGMGNALSLDSEGKPRISYFEEHMLKYAQQKDGQWSIELLDLLSPMVGVGWAGLHSSLVMDRDGFPHIAFGDAGTLKHVYWDGSKWRIEVVAAGGAGQYRYPSLVIDQQDNLYISYQVPSDQSLKVAVGRPRAESHEAVAEKE